MTGALVLLTRWPEPGLVKTRLAAAVGPAAACRLYRACVEDVWAALAEGGTRLGRGWRRTAAFTPPEREAEVRAWLGPEALYAPQRGADLGQRLAAVFGDAFAQGAEAALAVGGDLPALAPSDLTRAAARLAEADAVLAPAGDGGYSLIGFRAAAFRPDLLAGVPWSDERTLSATLASLARAGLAAALLPPVPDVDDWADLVRFWRRKRPDAGSRTRAALTSDAALRRRLEASDLEGLDRRAGGCPG